MPKIQKGPVPEQDVQMDAQHLAPCGMNCALCTAFQRKKRACGGCLGGEKDKPKHCRACAMRACRQRPSGMRCDTCTSFPCKPLKAMDARYRKRCGMGMVDNLRQIREQGVEAFLCQQRAQYTCGVCGHLLCVHETACPHCGESVTWNRG